VAVVLLSYIKVKCRNKRMFVHPESRGKIFSQILEELESWAKNHLLLVF
jgi:hypothetical protein